MIFQSLSYEIVEAQDKVTYLKYSKHLPYTVASTIDYGCHEMLIHGLNHGFFLSLFKLIYPAPYIELYVC